MWPAYFQTIGTKLLLGRAFDERDTSGPRPVAIVNDEFVRRYLPNRNPLGARFGIGGSRHAGDLEIVGVVANAKYDSPRDDLMPMAFFPLPGVAASQTPVSDAESNRSSRR